MWAIQEKLKNPLTRAPDEADRVRLGLLFCDLAEKPQTHFLALRRYANACPERFFDREVHVLMLDWLKRRDERQRGELQDWINSHAAEISRAMLFLRQINLENWHDTELATGNDFDLVRLVDTQLHAAYLRLVEGVLAPLIQPVAYFARRDRGKGTDGLDLYNSTMELRDTAMASCVNAYRPVIRNAIGHGSVTYLQNSFRYRDKKGNEETLDTRSTIRLCDDMLDICNGLASAFKVFLILSRENGYCVPHELFVEALVEETRSPWWCIEGCVESEVPDARQLLIYVRPNSRDAAKIHWAALQSAIMAEYFAPGYDRYFFSLHSPSALPGWANFNGHELRRLRESGAAEVHEYVTAVEQGGIFYSPKLSLPRIVARFETLLLSFRLQWPLVTARLREGRGVPSIVSRSAHMHRNGWRAVLKGAVVLEEFGKEPAADTVRVNGRRIIRKASKHARTLFRWYNPIRYLPLGYASVSVFSMDFRRRRLNAFGLGPELTCTIQLKRIGRIRTPDLWGSTVQTHRGLRIAWNEAWIASRGRIGAETKETGSK